MGQRRAGDGRLPLGDRPRRAGSCGCGSGLTETEQLLDQAEAALAPEAASEVSTFLGAFTILLREGLEALLVVIAMIAFLRKAERAEALPYVHGGWVGALVAGAGTWARGDLCDRDQRREPRTDRGLRLAAGRRHPPVGRHLDARQEPGRGMAPLHPGEDAGRLVARLGLVPVRPGVHRRLSRGVRDDPVLCGAVDARQWRDHPRRRADRRRRCWR